MKTLNPKQMAHTNFKVEAEDELLQFLFKSYPNSSRKSVKNMLTKGQVYVDNQAVTQYNHPLKVGQTVSVVSGKELKRRAVLSDVEIIYEDEDLLVVNKAAGILSVAGINPEEETVYRQLTKYVKEKHPANRIFVVHRLDKDTSGVLLFAKNEEMKNKLQDNWQELVKERQYVALVEGKVKQEEGEIASWLTVKDSMKVHSSPYDNGGKYALTHYKVLQTNDRYSLLDIQLETGRKNQIRVHMSDHGHPVVGDKKYGAQSNPLKRMGLHATSLVVSDPRTNKLMTFSSKVPKVFYKQK